MISNIIVDGLDSAIATLTKQTDLFAEYGKGDKYTVVKTLDAVNPVDEIEEYKASPIQILLMGWSATAGETLARQIVTAVKALSGVYTYGGENYNIRQVSFRNYPTFIKYMGMTAYTMNFVVYYIN